MRELTQAEESKGRRRGLGPFSGGQLTAIIIVLVLVIGLPVGAFATLSFSNVAITDPGGVNRARVDNNGSLQVKTSGYPNGVFHFADEYSGGAINLALPACSTTLCHYQITDITLSQTNSNNLQLWVEISLWRDGGNGNCSTLGTKLTQVLPAAFMPVNTTVVINLTTPTVVGASGRVCLMINTPTTAGSEFSYTVNGSRQTY